jgi:hypothetical protein
VKTTREELVKQFTLASRLSQKLGEASEAREQFSALQRQLDERRKTVAGNAALQGLLVDVEKKLAWAGPAQGNEWFMQLGLALPEKHPEPPARIVSALGTLITYVESADAAPTADMTKASEAWLSAADETIARWHAFLTIDLPTTNNQLVKAGQEALSTTGNAPTERHHPDEEE